MSDVIDPFDFDSGQLDNVKFTVEHAEFTYNNRIDSGNAVLSLSGKASDWDTGDAIPGQFGGEPGELEQQFGCGANWEPRDGGQSITRTDGKNKSFNESSAVARLITRLVELGAKDQMVANGGPLKASAYVGLTLHLKQEEKDYGGEIGKKSRLMPVGIVGSQGETKTASTAASDRAAAAKERLAAQSGDIPGNENAALVEALRTLATQCASHDEFIDKAFSVEGVNGNEEIESMVVREDGIYAEAQAVA